MEREIINVSRQDLSEVLKNSIINITMTEWPAATVLITLCLSGVAIYGMKTYVGLKE